MLARFKFPLAPGGLGAEQAAKGTKAHRARGDCGIRHRVNHAQILSGEEWRLALRWRRTIIGILVCVPSGVGLEETQVGAWVKMERNVVT